MENCFSRSREWKVARKKTPLNTTCKNRQVTQVKRWVPPGSLKVNVDASFYPEADTFFIGMVIGNHEGLFIEGRSMTLPRPANVFEAECIGVREALADELSISEFVVNVPSSNY